MRYGVWAISNDEKDLEAHWSYGGCFNSICGQLSPPEYCDERDNRFIISDINLAYKYKEVLEEVEKDRFTYEIREK